MGLKKGKAIEYFLSILDGDLHLVKEISQECNEQLALYIRDLTVASVTKDYKTEKSLLHQLKGTLGYLGLNDEALFINKIQEMPRANGL